MIGAHRSKAEQNADKCYWHLRSAEKLFWMFKRRWVTTRESIEHGCNTAYIVEATGRLKLHGATATQFKDYHYEIRSSSLRRKTTEGVRKKMPGNNA